MWLEEGDSGDENLEWYSHFSTVWSGKSRRTRAIEIAMNDFAKRDNISPAKHYVIHSQSISSQNPALDNHILPVSGPREPSNPSPTSITLSLMPRSSELLSHSETVPYLQHEPEESIDEAEKQKFLDHIFPGSDASAQQDLDFSDLRYDSAQPRKAEMAVTERLNKLISSSSKSASSSLN